MILNGEHFFISRYMIKTIGLAGNKMHAMEIDRADVTSIVSYYMSVLYSYMFGMSVSCVVYILPY